MRNAAVGVLMILLTVPASLAQDAPSERTACFIRIMEAVTDVEVLQRLLELKLTDAQLQGLAVVYQQFPQDPGLLAKARDAAQKGEACRAKLLTEPAGDLMNLPEAKAMWESLSVIGELFGGNVQVDDDFAVALRPDEQAVWALLDPAQRGTLLRSGDARAAARRVLEAIDKLRGREAAEWLKARDRLANGLAAGAAGTAARDNSRQLLGDFLDRARRLNEADLARQHEELVSGLALLLPPGNALADGLAGCLPGFVRTALAGSLLRSQAPALVQALQASRAQRAAAPARP